MGIGHGTASKNGGSEEPREKGREKVEGVGKGREKRRREQEGRGDKRGENPGP